MTRKRISREIDTPRPRRLRLGMILGGLGVIAACVAAKYYWDAEPAKADSPLRSSRNEPAADTPQSQSASPAFQPGWPRAVSGPPAASFSPPVVTHKSIPPVVATINGREITRQELGRECILHYGREVLDSIINRQLIVAECQRQRIQISGAEVNREIQRLAKRFSLPVDQWLKLLQQERNITPKQYAADIIWPTLALRRLAGNRLNVSRDELVKYFEMNYGPKVSAQADHLPRPRGWPARSQAQAAAHPENFANLAKKYSEDANSASLGGMIHPICKNSNYKEIEQAAFQMSDGAVSKVIPAAGQFVIIKREHLLPAKDVRLEECGPEAGRVAAGKEDAQPWPARFSNALKKRSNIEVVISNPDRQRQMPGIAAVVDGAQITVGQLAEDCIARHGQEVLEGLIGRKLIEQACQQQHVAVSEPDLDAEVARVASIMLPLLARRLSRREGLPQDGCRQPRHFRRHLSPRFGLAVGRLEEAGSRQDQDHRGGHAERLRGQLRAASAMPGDRAGPTPQGPAGLGNGPQTAHARAFRRPGGGIFHRGQQPRLAGRSAPIAKHSGQPELEKEAFA